MLNFLRGLTLETHFIVGKEEILHKSVTDSKSEYKKFKKKKGDGVN